jgi:hypothetical protein
MAGCRAAGRSLPRNSPFSTSRACCRVARERKLTLSLSLLFVRRRMASNFARPITSARSVSNAGAADQAHSACAHVLPQRMRRPAPQNAGNQHIGVYHRSQEAPPEAGPRCLRSMRAACTSALISSIDIGSMPAAATRSAMDSSESAASRRLSASVNGRSSACGVSRPAARGLRRGVGQFAWRRAIRSESSSSSSSSRAHAAPWVQTLLELLTLDKVRRSCSAGPGNTDATGCAALATIQTRHKRASGSASVRAAAFRISSVSPAHHERLAIAAGRGSASACWCSKRRSERSRRDTATTTTEKLTLTLFLL